MRNVVVGYDFSLTGRAALRHAVALATREQDVVLHVVCVLDSRDPLPTIPADGPIDRVYAGKVQQALALAVHDELRNAHPPHRVSFVVHARVGRPAQEIVALADELVADAIVVGSHGLTGLERVLVGSVSEKVVRDARCSVEVIRDVAGVPAHPRASLQAWPSSASRTTRRSS